MRVVIQRVTHSSVKVDEEIISSIGAGLLVLVGINKNDTKEDVKYISRKILNLKFFKDDSMRNWTKNVVDKQYEVMCVSQFTLCYSLKGNKLDFHHAMNAENSKKLYEEFLEEMRSQYKPDMIKDGKFGANMQVDLCNDGPVTIHLISPREEKQNKVDSHNDAIPLT